MAEERGTERPAEVQAERTPAVPPKKKKKRSKLGLLLLLVILSLGVAVGLHFSGLWDGRPLFWRAVPRIPYVGDTLARFFKVPERYTLTVAERRRLELEEWQRRLDEREREVRAAGSDLAILSADLEKRSAALDRQELFLTAASFDREAGGADADERKLVEQVAKTYQDMSARNAAQIVEQLREDLAVDLLRRLPVDVRASILGKIKPMKAARLTELMSGHGR